MKRKNFPETSHIAHVNKTDESKQRDYDRIVTALNKIGSGNYEDIAKSMKEKELNVVSRRLSEMVVKGYLENTGLKKNTSRNRPAFIYQLCSDYKKSPVEIVDDILKISTNKVLDNPLFNFLTA